MKIVIIGGGIAGLSFGIMMNRRGHQVVINERNSEIPLSGNAFMVHDHGLSILKKIVNNDLAIPGASIDSFILKRPDNKEVKHTKMEAWQCVKRIDLIKTLLNVVDSSCLKFGRSFSHFIYEGKKAIGVAFENGDIEMGDLFIGADGCNSQVRQILFGETKFTPTKVQEILGIVKNAEFVKKLDGVFTKYQDAERGLSFGCIPFSDNEAIWFNQFDVSLVNKELITKKDLYDFMKLSLKDFPEIVHAIIEATDFSGSYLWNTKDFDVLDRFHKNNIVLIGDAAHLALPFTSAGTTNALYDAEKLASCLDENKNFEEAFMSFYNQRAEAVKEHLELGRRLQRNFINPTLVADDDIEIPLIKFAAVKQKSNSVYKHFEILYFTDPICSTCWSIQPQLRKLKMNYQNNINLKYLMGGLLPSWDNFNRGGIQKPEDVFVHWKEVYEESKMPIDGSVWLDEPIQSSYPASVAFKALQMQNMEQAIIFLRLMNEIVFLESKNISNINIIRKASFDAGLDIARLLRDMENKALPLFYDDLEYAKELGINILPTFVFKVCGEVKEFLYGAQTYETFEKTILKHHPKIKQSFVESSPKDLFKTFPVLTMHEFQFLTASDFANASQMIDELLSYGTIKKVPTKLGFSYYAMAG
jgi:2-polyprenyl-6-methoxyphenol hydroxylase-like FAD-dependent oxidoreductase/predicted DsbA family dithiol-disulfide isomerase